MHIAKPRAAQKPIKPAVLQQNTRIGGSGFRRWQISRKDPPTWSRARATMVACCSLTASSIEMPEPELRISTPSILAETHGAVLVRAGQGDVEGQDLVVIPRGGQLVSLVDIVT